MLVGIVGSNAGSNSGSNAGVPAGGSNPLTITVDDHMVLFFDGVQQVNLPNIDTATVPDTIALPNNVSTIMVQGSSNGNYAGILGSDQDGRVTTSSVWKCTTTYDNGWLNSAYDDSSWPKATAIVANDGTKYWSIINGIRTEAKWIWSPNYLAGGDNNVYCRCKPSAPATTKRRKSFKERYLNLFYACSIYQPYIFPYCSRCNCNLNCYLTLSR